MTSCQSGISNGLPLPLPQRSTPASASVSRAGGRQGRAAAPSASASGSLSLSSRSRLLRDSVAAASLVGSRSNSCLLILCLRGSGPRLDGVQGSLSQGFGRVGESCATTEWARHELPIRLAGCCRRDGMGEELVRDEPGTLRAQLKSVRRDVEALGWSGEHPCRGGWIEYISTHMAGESRHRNPFCASNQIT